MAINKAAHGEIPDVMRCFYLTDVVFFTTPIYPKEVGLDIVNNLESFTYIDKDNPTVTVKILEKATKNGIDLWSADPTVNPEEIFHNDKIKYQLALIHNQLGNQVLTEYERKRVKKVNSFNISQENYEYIIGSKTDLIKIDKENAYISLPFISSSKNYNEKLESVFGRMLLYKMYTKIHNVGIKLIFNIACEKEDEEVKELVNRFNHEEF